MLARNRDAKPDKWEERIRQPVHPAEISDTFAVIEAQIQPYVQELVDAEARQKIDLESIGLEVHSADVEIAFERRDTPAKWAISEDEISLSVHYPYVGHCGLALIELVEATSRQVLDRGSEVPGVR